MPDPSETDFQRMLRTRARQFHISGIPAGTDEHAAALLRGRLSKATQDFVQAQRLPELSLTVSTAEPDPPASANGSSPAPAGGPDRDALSLTDRASFFTATEPEHSFDFLVLSEETMAQLLLAVDVVELRELVFDRWNLRSIEPHPNSAISLHGPSGTGKTLAAHAIAHRLGRRIIQTKYSQLESKYHGEGPKNLDALFHAARTNNAVLFLDEADSLMSKRFEVTSQGSEHAVNAMRSELLMALDRFEGLVIFATNLVTSYDPAFDTRVRHVEFPLPDTKARESIWRNHLPPGLPLAPDVSCTDLAAVPQVTGREIKRAVIDAATKAARQGHTHLTQADLLTAVEHAKTTRQATRPPQPIPLEPGSPLDTAIRDAAAQQHHPAD